ncbi:hypothetical protein ACHAW5_001696 [Stephanodiscus triporus]|uniref:Uncharacterized protein n=1 Tax=Stephanodiscus triporus TaxID=2934178 RepID=A0ABD3Q7Q5_9STRA
MEYYLHGTTYQRRGTRLLSSPIDLHKRHPWLPSLLGCRAFLPPTTANARGGQDRRYLVLCQTYHTSQTNANNTARRRAKAKSHDLIIHHFPVERTDQAGKTGNGDALPFVSSAEGRVECRAEQSRAE